MMAPWSFGPRRRLPWRPRQAEWRLSSPVGTAGDPDDRRGVVRRSHRGAPAGSRRARVGSGRQPPRGRGRRGVRRPPVARGPPPRRAHGLREDRCSSWRSRPSRRSGHAAGERDGTRPSSEGGVGAASGAVLDLPTIGVTDRPLLAPAPSRLPSGGRAQSSSSMARSSRRARGPGSVPERWSDPGWRTDLPAAIDLVRRVDGPTRTPEPLRTARRAARLARAHDEARPSGSPMWTSWFDGRIGSCRPARVHLSPAPGSRALAVSAVQVHERVRQILPIGLLHDIDPVVDGSPRAMTDPRTSRSPPEPASPNRPIAMVRRNARRSPRPAAADPRSRARSPSGHPHKGTRAPLVTQPVEHARGVPGRFVFRDQHRRARLTTERRDPNSGEQHLRTTAEPARHACQERHELFIGLTVRP